MVYTEQARRCWLQGHPVVQGCISRQQNSWVSESALPWQHRSLTLMLAVSVWLAAMCLVHPLIFAHGWVRIWFLFWTKLATFFLEARFVSFLKHDLQTLSQIFFMFLICFCNVSQLLFSSSLLIVCKQFSNIMLTYSAFLEAINSVLCFSGNEKHTKKIQVFCHCNANHMTARKERRRGYKNLLKIIKLQ